MQNLHLGDRVYVRSARSFGNVLGFSGRDVKVILDGRASWAWWDMFDVLRATEDAGIAS